MGANLELIFSQAWTGLRRHSLVALGAVINIAISLAILGGFFLFAANVEHIARHLAEEATIVVLLRDDADVPALKQQLERDGRIREAKFVSKDTALEEYAKAVGIPYKDLKNSITNPLPDTFRVRVSKPDDLPAVVQMAKSLPGVQRVRYPRDVAEKLLRIARGTRLLGLILGGLMTLAALMLVSTTIQLGVHSRRREIRIMQLVGATNNFIRAPFLIEGAVQGLLGGVLAALLALLGYSYAHNIITAALPFLNLIYNTKFLLLAGIGLIGCGIFFGVIGSLLGTRHYLKII